MKWMRPTVVTILAVCMLGCAAKPKTHQAGKTLEKHQYEPAVATALVFEPPISVDQAPLVLARIDHEPYAVIGFDQTTTTVFNIYYNDTQYGSGSLPSLWFQRQAVSERFGISYR